jgi:hypothetical protein
MYAIINARNKKWLYGTDYNYNPRRQRVSENKAQLFSDEIEAEFEFKKRKCGKCYKVVKVELTIIK